MKQKLTYFVSALVLITFSLYLVPHEVVHVFYDHHDTEHSDADHNASEQLSSIHIHCNFLNTDLTDFLPADEIVRTECTVELPVHYSVVDVQAVRCVSVLRDSRGPPLS